MIYRGKSAIRAHILLRQNIVSAECHKSSYTTKTEVCLQSALRFIYYWDRSVSAECLESYTTETEESLQMPITLNPPTKKLPNLNILIVFIIVSLFTHSQGEEACAQRR